MDDKEIRAEIARCPFSFPWTLAMPENKIWKRYTRSAQINFAQSLTLKGAYRTQTAMTLRSL